MPTIKFELKDQELCNGCIFLKKEESCDLLINYCTLLKKNVFIMTNVFISEIERDLNKKIKRPQECIDNLGE
jgi:hypothetical protein